MVHDTTPSSKRKPISGYFRVRISDCQILDRTPDTLLLNRAGSSPHLQQNDPPADRSMTSQEVDERAPILNTEIENASGLSKVF